MGTHSDFQRDPDKCLSDICLLSFPGPKPGSGGLRTGFFPPSPSLLGQDQAHTQLPCCQPYPSPPPTAPLAALSLQTPVVRATPRGPVGGKGGACSKSSVGGGCASRGAWAGGGRGHEETRDGAGSPDSKITGRGSGGRAPHTPKGSGTS